VIGAPEPEARRLLARLRDAASEPMPAAARVRLVERANPLARAHWVGAVSKALAAIASRAVRKVVLARDRVLDSGQAIDPWALMRLVHGQDPHGSRFCFRFDAHAAFMGASPERLVSHRGTRLAIDCLAGTIARGDTPQEESRNAAALLASEKDGREHRIVREEVLAAIAPHTLSHEAPDAPSILPLPGIQHLWSPIRAQLREGVRLGDLVGSLHPTPAVGGSPRPAAMDMIRELEGRSRGWYAGVVGWIGADAADFAVAIRSGVVRGPRLTVFGGAGIVRGSDPLAEWDETARKATSFVNLFAERA
jgi:menaquinone-specific isochorismate synthase